MNAKNIISIFLTVLIASTVIVGGAYAVKHKWYDQKDPGLVVLNFYEQWVEYEGNPVSDRIYQDHPAISSEFSEELDRLLDSFEGGAFDPVLCAQEKPSSVKIKDIKEIGDRAQLTLTADFFGVEKDLNINLEKTDRTWWITDITCPASNTTPSKTTPWQEIVEDYIRGNISEISPEEEVLGGNFYVTDFEFLNNNKALVKYEDGHIALEAEIEFNIDQDMRVDINSFKILNKPDSEDSRSEEIQDEQAKQIDKRAEAERYIKENISDLSPEGEVLGGSFYVTNIDFTGDNSALVSYEDGHIALEAEVTFNVSDTGEVNVESFEVLD